MNSATDNYNSRVWQFLEKIPAGKRYKVDALAEEATKEKFVAAIKEYMTALPYDGWISFNSDFTEFYRTPAVPLEQLKKLQTK